MTGPRLSRRSLLARGAPFGAMGLVGCLGDDDEPPGDDGNVTDSVDGDATDDDSGRESENEDDAEVRQPDEIEVETVIDGLTHPWAIGFLPEAPYFLVTQREAELVLVSRETGDAEVVSGGPETFTGGQGGLLDLALDPSFPDEPWVYLTYSIADDDFYTTTALGRGRLNVDLLALEDFERIHEVEPRIQSDGHFGSRVIVGPDEHIYMTTGDRQEKDFGPDHVSQDLSNELGATLRLEPTGEIPADNPFVDEEGAADAVFSYGHRNSQGMTVHPTTGEIWQSEHGEQDGDEINIIEAGGNYGWPIAHYGCTYSGGSPIGDEPHERADIVDPVYYWECNSGGFPPAGATFYSGETFPDWEGDLFVGNLAGRYLGRFRVNGRDVEEVDPLLDGRDWRIRDVAVAPDTDDLYVAVDAEEAPIVRIGAG